MILPAFYRLRSFENGRTPKVPTVPFRKQKRTSNTMSQASPPASPPHGAFMAVPTCKCGLRCSDAKYIQKAGPNQGKRFWGCPKFGTDNANTRCNFFQLVPETEMSQQFALPQYSGSQSQGSPPASPEGPAMPRFYKTPSVSQQTQEPTPGTHGNDNLAYSLPPSELASFGRARIEAKMASQPPPSPSPLSLPKHNGHASLPAEDELFTPVDRVPPPYGVNSAIPPTPRKRAHPHEEHEYDIRPRRLFEESQGWEDTQGSQSVDWAKNDGNPFLTAPTGSGVSNNAVSGISPQLKGSPASSQASVMSSETISEYVKGLETDNTKLKRQLAARDGKIKTLMEEIKRLKGGSGAVY